MANRAERLTKREVEAIKSALGLALAGEIEAETEAQAERFRADAESAQAKICTFNRVAYARERAILKLLNEALNEIQDELNAAGSDETEKHPLLMGKQQFVRRARARVYGWTRK